MTNGTTETPETKEIKPKQSWEEKIIATFFAWRQKLLPHLLKPRLSDEDKNAWRKVVKTLVRLLPTLFFIGVTLGFLGTKGCYIMAERANINATAVNEVASIEKELMIINPQLDPAVAPIIADEIIGAAKALDLDRDLIVAVIKYESGCKINAKNPNSGAMGLTQWLVTAQRLRDLGLQEYQVSHIHTNIWEGAKVLWDGFQVKINKKTGKQVGDGSAKAALFYYNGVTTNIAGGNEYAANVLGRYFDMKHRKVVETPPPGR